MALPAQCEQEEVTITARVDRLIAFASDTAELADRRRDLDLRRLIDDLYRDLIDLEEER